MMGLGVLSWLKIGVAGVVALALVAGVVQFYRQKVEITELRSEASTLRGEKLQLSEALRTSEANFARERRSYEVAARALADLEARRAESARNLSSAIATEVNNDASLGACLNRQLPRSVLDSLPR